jgi:hypothetical protein
VVSFTDTAPIPNDVVLFTCGVPIASDAAPGSYALTVSNTQASTLGGLAIETTGVAGTVTVNAPAAAAVSILAGGESLCSGGPQDGMACDGDAQCAGWPCVRAQGVCDGGDDDGLLCDCPGGQCDAQSVCGADPSRGTCRGGTADGQCCDVDSACAGGSSCTETQRDCLGGVGKGLPCIRDAQCPHATCGSNGSFCKGGAFDRYACVDDRDCPLSTCQVLVANTPGRGTPGATRTATPQRVADSISGSGGTCAIVPPAAARPEAGWLIVLPAALLAWRARSARVRRAAREARRGSTAQGPV